MNAGFMALGTVVVQATVLAARPRDDAVNAFFGGVRVAR
jgi:hypothetical protein